MPISTINNINIENFFSIDKIELNALQDKREIYIVGENGDGKSLFLQALMIALVGVQEGEVFNFVKAQQSYNLSIIDSNGEEFNHDPQKSYKYVFGYGSARNNYCQMREDTTGYLTLFKSEYDLKNPLKWLQYLDYKERSGEKGIVSTQKAKEILQYLLSSDVEIQISPDKVTFLEKGSETTFEHLSSGYQGVIIVICDLIARLSESQPDAESIEDFRGIVLIDEVELHLHPKWKYNFMHKLREAFPLIQFIVTTHSPTVILGASPEAVFYKIYKSDGKVQISNQIPNDGYTHNSLVSSPLFDLEEISSRNYKKHVSSSDYVYSKIHKVISNQLKKDIAMDESELLNLIEKELEHL